MGRPRKSRARRRKRGLDRPWCDGVHANPCSADLRREALRQHHEAGLRDAVVGDCGGEAVGRDAGDWQVFSLAYSGLGVSLALKTGSNQVVQLSFLVFFPLIFLSPAFAPKEVFSGWLQFLATINPITYVLEGCRSLVLEGWDAAALGKAFAAIAGMATLTVSMTGWAYRHRKV